MIDAFSKEESLAFIKLNSPKWAAFCCHTGWHWIVANDTENWIMVDHDGLTITHDEYLAALSSDVETEKHQPFTDMVNHPPHYQSDSGIECIDAIRAALGSAGFIAYCRGNDMKYVWREKINAAFYLDRAASELEQRNEQS